MMLPPLPVVLPLLIAAVLAGAGDLLKRWMLDLIGCLTAAVVLVVCCVLAARSTSAPIVYWFGGWTPDRVHHFPVGVCFVIDPFAAGLAALVALLTLAALVFSWRYFKGVKSLYHALMLAFMAAMCGLCLTGDLFNLFVWFELMTATGVALCGYESEEKQPLQGAINFAVVNTIGAFLSLIGVSLIYARTGALNMSGVASSLASHPPGLAFISVVFLFLCAGFLVKGAAVPFHFWLADAHAVAPTPVCILFSGVMVELGVYAVARVYWSAFASGFERHHAGVRDVFIVVGVLTAVTGAVYCFGQRHLKRLLAFSTISHTGLLFVGFALLKPRGLAGAAIYLLGHGMIKASLFICAGTLLHVYQSVDEFDLKGRGRRLPFIGCMVVAGALGLAGLPPFATFYGQTMIDRALEEANLSWITAAIIFAEAVTAAAVLRAAARIFLGIGGPLEATLHGAPHIPMDSETDEGHAQAPMTMWVPAAVLLLAAMAIGLWLTRGPELPGLARSFQNTEGVASWVLKGQNPHTDRIPDMAAAALSWRQPFTLAVAVALALTALNGGSFTGRPAAAAGKILRGVIRPLRQLQSGCVGDYVAWFVLGMAFYGALLLMLTR